MNAEDAEAYLNASRKLSSLARDGDKDAIFILVETTARGATLLMELVQPDPPPPPPVPSIPPDVKEEERDALMLQKALLEARWKAFEARKETLKACREAVRTVAHTREVCRSRAAEKVEGRLLGFPRLATLVTGSAITIH